MPEELKKYTTYIESDILAAMKRFSLAKGYKDYAVINAALRKVIPEKYFKDPYAE